MNYEIRNARKKLRLTQQELADLCKVNRQTIKNIEVYGKKPSLVTALRLCAVLGIDIKKVFNYD